MVRSLLGQGKCATGKSTPVYSLLPPIAAGGYVVLDARIANSYGLYSHARGPSLLALEMIQTTP
jgi:hypothetical protein